MVVQSTDHPTAASAPTQLALFLATLSSAVPAPDEQLPSRADSTAVYEEYKRQKERQRLLHMASKGKIARDSQLQRNKPGKEGSRRRRRQDNDSFADHPMIKGLDSLYDQRDMYLRQMPQPATIFTRLPSSIRNNLTDVSVAETPTVATANGKQQLCHCTKSIGFHALAKSDRLQLSRLIKWGQFREADLALLELSIRDFFEDIWNPTDTGLAQDSCIHDAYLEEEEWVVIGNDSVVPSQKPLVQMDSSKTLVGEAKTQLNLSQKVAWGCNWTTKFATDDFSKTGEDGWCQITPTSGSQTTFSLIIRDQFLKIAVHSMAKYYGLLSKSVDDECGERITHINFFPSGKECTQEPQGLELDCHKTRTSSKSQFLVPETNFTDFFYRRTEQKL
ncbi:hypothetical protein BDR26DRAFT_851917 [Obelidium mucronatum]|nr:hypothetical protein BDR26DRAFT_851917 [Obelidium mucronatum]